MRRSLLVAVLLVLLLLGGAFVLYGQLFGDPADDNPVVTTVTPVEPVTPPPADAGPAAPDAGPAPAVDAGAAEPMSRKARVVAVSGLVTTRGTGADGEWKELKAGDELDPDMSVRTGRGAEAKLQVGNGVEVRLSPRSEFSIREITEGVSRVRLEQGRVSASVDENGKQVLKVEAQGSDAVVESSGGRFGMVTDGKGQVAVATETGKVKLSAKGKTVDVEAGQQSTVSLGSAPSAPTAVPKSLFLKVVDPVKRTTNRRQTVVRGQTEPGTLVRVEGELAQVDAKGRFKVPVALKDGVNRIDVEVEDARGRTKAYSMPDVVVDRKKPEIEAEMEWGNK